MFYYFKAFLIHDEKIEKTPILWNKETIHNNEISMISGENDNTIINNGNQKKLGQSNVLVYDVDISNASATWIREPPENFLNNINLSISRGQLVAIVGRVGAGKV